MYVINLIFYGRNGALKSVEMDMQIYSKGCQQSELVDLPPNQQTRQSTFTIFNKHNMRFKWILHGQVASDIF